jgi:cysteine desulfurase/selenocysteine lyase
LNQTNSIAEIRSLFPVLNEQVNGKQLVYLDNAATTQKPISVINALQSYYLHDNANIHRSAHTLASRATEQFESTRELLQTFINAKESAECIFTKGVTESINLVAASYGKLVLKPGDEVLLTEMEHHSNLVPWQRICAETGSVLKFMPVQTDGSIDLEAALACINPKVKIVSMVWVSNALGTINPIATIIKAAHAIGAKVMIDAAQAASHFKIDVQALDCDFMAISSHKLYGPTGLGVLYGKRELLTAMPPYQSGGEMIKEVFLTHSTYNELPYKFEAGTPNIADVIAFKMAIQFVLDIGHETIAAHEISLYDAFLKGIQHGSFDKINLIGTNQQKIAVQSFNLFGMHHFDVGMLLDASGIAVRTGHHCTQPLMRKFGLEGTVRASFAIYNTTQEIDYFLAALQKICDRIK